MCDVAYVLLLDRVERQYLADRTGLVSAALTAGEEDVTPPALDDRIAEFDRALAEAPAPLTERELRIEKIRQLMGVA